MYKTHSDTPGYLNEDNVSLLRKFCLSKENIFSITLGILFILFLGGCRFEKGFLKQNERLEKELLGYTSGENPRIKEVQVLLKEKGFDPGKIDGKFQDQTRISIQRFQKFRGLKSTGYMDATTFRELNRFVKFPTVPSLSQQPIKVLSSHPLNEIFPALNELNKRDENKISSPKSHYSIKLQTKSSPKSFALYRRSGNNGGRDIKSKEVNKYSLDVQKALKNAGFDPGAIDGKMGKRTKEAIIRFQSSQGLISDGVIGEKTWKKLSLHLKEASAH